MNVVKLDFRRDHYYMSLARGVAKLSPCEAGQVGAVIYDEDGIISDGYNRNAMRHHVGFSEEMCSAWCPRRQRRLLGTQVDGPCYAIHAEEDAIRLAEYVGASMAVTRVPCLRCAKQIISAGITRIVVETTDDEHDVSDVLRFFQVCGAQLVVLGSDS